MKNVLVIGGGSIGERHVRNLQSLGVEIQAVVEPNQARWPTFRTLGAPCYEDAVAAVEATKPEAVFVCSPPAWHLEHARLALSAGAHLFIEKPISHSLDGIADLIASAAAQRRAVHVGYNLRFHGPVRRMKELVDDGTLGRVLCVQARFGQYLPDWRPTTDYRRGYITDASAGGGIILDASHEIDYARWLLGEIDGVSAVAGHLSDLEMQTEDFAALHLRSRDGAYAEIHLDCIQRGYDRGCRVIASKGTAVWDFGGPLRYVREGEKQWNEEPFSDQVNDMYVAQSRYFMKMIAENPNVDSARDAQRVLEIALAARRSAREHREVVLS